MFTTISLTTVRVLVAIISTLLFVYLWYNLTCGPPLSSTAGFRMFWSRHLEFFICAVRPAVLILLLFQPLSLTLIMILILFLSQLCIPLRYAPSNILAKIGLNALPSSPAIILSNILFSHHLLKGFSWMIPSFIRNLLLLAIWLLAFSSSSSTAPWWSFRLTTNGSSACPLRVFSWKDLFGKSPIGTTTFFMVSLSLKLVASVHAAKKLPVWLEGSVTKILSGIFSTVSPHASIKNGLQIRRTMFRGPSRFLSPVFASIIIILWWRRFKGGKIILCLTPNPVIPASILNNLKIRPAAAVLVASGFSLQNCNVTPHPSSVPNAPLAPATCSPATNDLSLRENSLSPHSGILLSQQGHLSCLWVSGTISSICTAWTSTCDSYLRVRASILVRNISTNSFCMLEQSVNRYSEHHAMTFFLTSPGGKPLEHASLMRLPIFAVRSLIFQDLKQSRLTCGTLFSCIGVLPHMVGRLTADIYPLLLGQVFTWVLPRNSCMNPELASSCLAGG